VQRRRERREGRKEGGGGELDCLDLDQLHRSQRKRKRRHELDSCSSSWEVCEVSEDREGEEPIKGGDERRWEGRRDEEDSRIQGRKGIVLDRFEVFESTTVSSGRKLSLPTRYHAWYELSRKDKLVREKLQQLCQSIDSWGAREQSRRGMWI